MQRKKNTSWNKVASWYDSLVDTKGHYFHEHLIIPNITPYFSSKNGALLDVACGQGIFERHIPKSWKYCGLDFSKDLIDAAEKRKLYKNSEFHHHDVRLPFPVKKEWSCALINLAIQNIDDQESVIRECSKVIVDDGSLIIVLNHPYYRIPRQSNWGVDEGQSYQYRRVNRYMTEMEIPITMQPSKGDQSEVTYSYHRPLSSLFSYLKKNNFVVCDMKELVSPKTSSGANKKAENRAREEFPMFMLLECRKMNVKK